MIDARTLEAFKPGTTNPPTRLVLQAGSAPAPARDPYTELALRYEERSRTDADNAHVWTACAAAAMGRALGDEAAFRALTVQTVQMLKPIMVNPATTPCADAIPAELWNSVQ